MQFISVENIFRDSVVALNVLSFFLNGYFKFMYRSVSMIKCINFLFNFLFRMNHTKLTVLVITKLAITNYKASNYVY